MIHLNTTDDKTLKIFLPNLNKALREVLKESTPKDLQLLSRSKDLGSLLESLIKNNPQDVTQNRSLLTLLKNNPTLKELANLTTTLKELQQTLLNENTAQFSKLTESVSKLLHESRTIDDKTLKSKLENSGVFLESKLKNISVDKLLENIKDDFKIMLNKTKEELINSEHPQKAQLLKHIDKLSLQIDYYQLLSHLSNASCIYLPYSFDALEDGNITLRSAKNKSYFCDIELQLKEYGTLNLRLGMFEKNQLNIDIICESQTLQEKMKKHIKELKEKLFHAGIYPKEIRFLNSEQKHTQHYNNEEKLQLGFEVKA